MSIRVEGEKSSDSKIILIPKYVKEFSIELLNDWIRMQSIYALQSHARYKI